MRAVVVVGPLLAGQRAHETVTVCQLAEARQQLANLDSRHCGGNRIVRAANPVGGGWLHVEGVELGRPTVLKDEDTGFMRPARGGPTGLKKFGQTQAEDTDAANLEKLAPIQQRRMVRHGRRTLVYANSSYLGQNLAKDLGVLAPNGVRRRPTL